MIVPDATRPAREDLSPPIDWAMAEREFPESGAYFDCQNPLRGREVVLRIAKRRWLAYTNAFYLFAFPHETDPILSRIGILERAPDNLWEGSAAWHARVHTWVTYTEWSPWVVWPQSRRQLIAAARLGNGL